MTAVIVYLLKNFNGVSFFNCDYLTRRSFF